MVGYLGGKPANWGAIAAIIVAVLLVAAALYYLITQVGLSNILNPQKNLTITVMLLISLILGFLHGATPDEHTWPITFSYAIGSYGTKGGMKAGFSFSLGFTIQRAFLTTLGYLGLAAFYLKYNLDGPVYVIVGIVMAAVGMYMLNKKIDLHIPFDALFKSEHHTHKAERMPMHDVKPKVAIVHGLIAGFGFGAYATIITFIIAPQMPSLLFAPLPGVLFGIGTMIMQIITGALFANLARIKKLSEKQIKYIGRKTAGRTLWYGGIAFAVIGAFVIAFPSISSFAISTGNPIPNLDTIDIATILVLFVVGVIGIGSMVLVIRDVLRKSRHLRETPKSKVRS